MSAGRGRVTELLVRRSPWATCHWAEDGCHLGDPAGQADILGDAHDVSLVAAADDWCDIGDLAARTSLGRGAVRTRVARLVRAGVLERGDRPASGAVLRAAGWRPWGVAALWFHAAARNVTWASADDTAPLVRARALERPTSPSPALPRSAAIALDPAPPAGQDPVIDTLRARRTWRRFAGSALSRAECSTLLHLSFGVQAWMQGRIGGPYAMKTSPSGGACHPLDAYVVVTRVEGLAPGVYQYDPDGHALHRIGRGGVPDLRRWFPGQAAYPAAAAVCVLVARFARVQWKYHTPRAYRVVLLDAGHVGQTFNLVATRLGLAPCGTGAFDDRVVERALGVDGIERAAIYAMGVGRRPGQCDWAPFPDPEDRPRVTAPASARRGGRGAAASRVRKRSGQ